MFSVKIFKEEDMNRILKSMLKNGEELKCKLCAMVTITDDNILKLKELENMDSVIGSISKNITKGYCYLGVTENEILVTILNSIDISKINNRLRIPLDEISSIEVAKSLFSKNIKVKITLRGNAIINLYVTSSILTYGMLSQKANASEFFKILSEL